MNTSIEINDLKRDRLLDVTSMRRIRGGASVSRGFLFRGAAAPSTLVTNQIFNIDELDYVVNTTYIDKFIEQTNNLSQINVTEVVAIDSVVDASVHQGQLGLNNLG